MKEARERLNRNSRNSSRPPSSEAPWEKERTGYESTDGFEKAEDAESGDETAPRPPGDSDRRSKEVGQKTTDEARKPGKQLGAEGFGRQQTLAVTGQTELTSFLWLWVFSTDSVTAYWIAYCSAELINNLLGEVYDGWLMSDGYQVYRKYRNRLRCWSHLLRKAQGLEESLDQKAQRFGTKTLELLGTLIVAVHEARGSPPGTPLTEIYQAHLSAYRCLCEQMTTVFHKPTRELATEMLNDWEAIFRVLQVPDLPLTNNEAERALRHWVILRRICYGTRTEEGSRIFAILISVIETCRKRQQSPWIYLAAVIHSHRTGLPVPKLPVAKGSE